MPSAVIAALVGAWCVGVGVAVQPSASPVKILVLLDAGPTMGWLTHLYVPAGVQPTGGSPAVESIKAAAAALGPNASMRVATFGDTFKASRTWERTSDALVAALDNVVVDDRGRSPVWDAVYGGVDVFEATPDRQVIVLISSGRATGNVHGFDEALDRVRSSRVVVHAACPSHADSFPKTLDADNPNSPCARLKRLADATRGRYSEPWVSRPQERELERYVADVVKDATLGR
jgi:hypothetical protein